MSYLKVWRHAFLLICYNFSLPWMRRTSTNICPKIPIFESWLTYILSRKAAYKCIYSLEKHHHLNHSYHKGCHAFVLFNQVLHNLLMKCYHSICHFNSLIFHAVAPALEHSHYIPCAQKKIINIYKQHRSNSVTCMREKDMTYGGQTEFWAHFSELQWCMVAFDIVLLVSKRGNQSAMFYVK